MPKPKTDETPQQPNILSQGLSFNVEKVNSLYYR